MARMKENLLKLISKTHRLLTVDIRYGFVRVLEVSYCNGEYQVEYCANFIIETKLNSVKKITEILRSVLGKTQFKTKKVAVAITHTNVIFKEVKVCVDLSHKEIVQFLEFNLEKQDGHSKDNIRFDYQIIDSSIKEIGYRTLQLVAVQQEHIGRLTNLLKSVGLLPHMVDVDIYACERAVRRQLKNIMGLVAVISIDFGNISTVVLNDTKIAYVNEEFIGDEGLSSVKQIVEQVDLKLQLACSSLVSGIDKVVLAGEKAGLPGLEIAINQSLKIPTIIANPFLGMRLASNISLELIKELAPMMLVSCGLALRVGDEYKN